MAQQGQIRYLLSNLILTPEASTPYLLVIYKQLPGTLDLVTWAKVNEDRRWAILRLDILPRHSTG